MIPIIDSFIRKNNLNKNRFNKNLLNKFTIITSTGKEAAQAMEYADSESALSAFFLNGSAQTELLSPITAFLVTLDL
jgi:hypothetical protein